MSAVVLVQAEDGETELVEIEYVRQQGGSATEFDTYQEVVYSVTISDGGVLFIDDGGGTYSAVSPTGWTRVSVVKPA